MTPDTIPTDLHGHSYMSDGRTTPESYVRFRAALGMQVIALSDHDTFAGVRRAAAAADIYGMALVPAMEVTSFIHFGTAEAEQIHVLAYFPPAMLEDGRLEQTALHARAQRVQERWREFVLRWLDSLPADDRHEIDPGRRLEAKEGAEFPGLQSVINLIEERCPMAFTHFHRQHARFWTDDDELFGWSPEEVIETIRGDGGLDIVAHPNRVRDKARMDAVLAYASGLEVYTSRHKDTVAACFRAYAEEHGKHWTASSDDHQHVRYMLPADGTPRRTVERILGSAHVVRAGRAQAPAASAWA